jgi:3-(3-hydroxy-phenyl)propionate hydroxylase
MPDALEITSHKTIATKSAHYPVIIVGAGPIGLLLTNLLGTAGIACLLVERRTATVNEPRAVSIDDESLRSMQAAGIVGAVLETIVPGYGSHYYTARRKCFTKVEPTGQPYGFPRRNAFRQPVLEKLLCDALSRFPHVTELFGWTLDRYEQDNEKVSLTLTGPAGETKIVTCDYLAGCDGAASRVRELQGVSLAGTTFNERWLILDLENHENTIKHTEVICDHRRPCITLPGPSRTRRFEFKLTGGESDAKMLAPDMVAHLLRTHGADPNATLIRKVVYRFHARVAPKWSFGRVFLAGDAAHLTPPFAGQGMNSGLRDAHNLFWKLAAVLRGTAGPGLLETYEQERKDHIWQMVRLALRMGKVMAPRGPLHAALVQTGFRALSIWPAARDYVTQMKYKPPPRFKQGFILPAGPGDRLVGRLLPQPLVHQADGTIVLLDEVLGNRFALIASGAVPERLFEQLDQPVWRQLDAVRVALLPHGANLESTNNVIKVTPLDDKLTASLCPYGDCMVLLRPDHYVAAILPAETLAGCVRDVETLLQQTWAKRGGLKQSTYFFEKK